MHLQKLMLSQSAAIGISVAAALAAALASMPLSRTPPTDEGTSVAVETMTHTVRTIPISRLPAPTVVAPLVLPDLIPQPEPPQTTKVEPQARQVAQYIMPAAPAHADICRRHNCIRVTTGRSWHCNCKNRKEN